jgi:hypothetical protein
MIRLNVIDDFCSRLRSFRFLNAEQSGTIRAVQPINRFSLLAAFLAGLPSEGQEIDDKLPSNSR